MDEAAEDLTFDDPCWLKAGEDLADFAATEPFNDGFLTTSAQQGAGSLGRPASPTTRRPWSSWAPGTRA